jgi:hypothetical protein
MGPGSVASARAILRIGGDALPEWAGEVGEYGLDAEELNAPASN